MTFDDHTDVVLLANAIDRIGPDNPAKAAREVRLGTEGFSIKNALICAYDCTSRHLICKKICL